MNRRMTTIAISLAASIGFAAASPVATAQDDATDGRQEMSESMRRAALTSPIQTIEALLGRIADLQQQMAALRVELAEAKLAESEAQRELAELRQFIRDHEQLGDDFEQYQQVKTIADREQREQERAEAREEYEAAKEERDARRRAALAELERQRAEADRLREYRDAGFSPLGLDVFASRMAFHYDANTTTPYRYDYERGFGHYRRYYPPISTVDYSQMTISGSILNAAETVRNVGVAIVFFDEGGNQVGQHIVQVNNARPNIPYPFTADIEMALNRPFDSSSTYVLYADPANADDTTYETWETSPDSPYARVK